MMQVRCAVWRGGRIACGFHLAVQMKLGFTLTLTSNVCVKSSNHRLTIRLSTNIAMINVERCVTIALVQGKKRSGRRAIETVTNHCTKMTSSKEQMKKFLSIVHQQSTRNPFPTQGLLIGTGTVLTIMSGARGKLLQS
jgi:hypothetical protein